MFLKNANEIQETPAEVHASRHKVKVVAVNNEDLTAGQQLSQSLAADQAKRESMRLRYQRPYDRLKLWESLLLKAPSGIGITFATLMTAVVLVWMLTAVMPWYQLRQYVFLMIPFSFCFCFILFVLASLLLISVKLGLRLARYLALRNAVALDLGGKQADTQNE